MSSFRIDRQYVAFETAETQSVFAANNVQKPKPAMTDPVQANSADITKLYNDIYEKLQREHAEQAEYMLSKATEDSRNIIEKAKKNAEEILSQASADAERMKAALTAELEAASSERKIQAEAAFSALETKLRNDYSSLLDEMNGDIIGLVMEIVKKIIGLKLSQSDDVFVGMIRDALERLKQTGAVVLRISPEDYLRYFGSGALGDILNTGEIKLAVAEDATLSNGALIVESEGEMIDLSIDRQIDLIEKSFLN